MYLMRPTGNPQVIRHLQHLNLDPQGPIATGEPDPQVTFVDPHPCPALDLDQPQKPRVLHVSKETQLSASSLVPHISAVRLPDAPPTRENYG